MAFTYGSVTNATVVGHGTRKEYEVRLGWQLNSQSIPNNTSNITLQLEVRSINSTYGTYGYKQTTTIDGTSLSSKSFDMRNTNVWQVFGTRTLDVKHNDNGTYSATKSASFSTTATADWGLKSGSAEVTFTLTQIPRFANISGFNVNYTTINTAHCSWSVDSTIDESQYSLDDSEWKSMGNVTSYTITNLEPASTHSIKIRVKRKDSQLWSGSGTRSFTTYDYAKIQTAPNFNDEENPTITYTNPFGDSVEYLEACISFTGSKSDVPYRAINKTGTLSYTFYLTEEERRILRKGTTTNTRQVLFVIRTDYNGKTYYSSVPVNFSIINGDPTFNDFEFADINPTTVKLLEGEEATASQSIILGYSEVQITIPVINKAIAKKEATMVKYRFNSIDANYSDSQDVIIPASKVNSGEFKVYAIDSRQNAPFKVKSATRIIHYTPLSKTNEIVVGRQGGITTKVNMSFSGKVDLENFGAVTNSLKRAQYRFAIAGKDNWSDWSDLTLNIDGEGNFEFNDSIKGDTEDLGFNINNAYKIEVIIEDELSTLKYTATFGAGIPHVAYSKNGVSIMGKYDESVGGLLQVGGRRVEEVAVSSTEPTTGEEVWIKKSQNLFENNMVYSTGNGVFENGVFTQTSADTSPYFDFKILGFDQHWDYTILAFAQRVHTPQKVHFVFSIPTNIEVISFGLNGSAMDSTVSFVTHSLPKNTTLSLSFEVTNLVQGAVSWESVQIESGETATDYEPYLDKKIFVKNNNGVYEEFYSQSNIGDIHITSTNQNPSIYLGGTWELVDKDLSYYIGTVNYAFTPNEEILTGSNLVMERTKDVIHFRLQIETVEGMGDGTNLLGTIDYKQLGISGFNYSYFSETTFCDTGNTILCVYFNVDGTIEVRDTMVKGGSTVAPACGGYINAVIPIALAYKLDEGCDKFYWKRTA